MVIKSGLFFVALEIGCIGAGLLTYLVILILFDFIFNRALNKKFLLISFMSSLILIGAGIGLGAISLVQFEIKENDNYIETEFSQSMTDDMVIINNRNFYNSYIPIEYIASDNTDVKIVVEHSRYSVALLSSRTNNIILNVVDDRDLTMDLIRQIIDDINNKKIITYDNEFKIKVYTTEENIKIIKDNEAKYFDLMNAYEERINELNNLSYEKDEQIQELNNKLDELMQELKNNGYQITYDEYGNLEIIGNIELE